VREGGIFKHIVYITSLYIVCLICVCVFDVLEAGVKSKGVFQAINPNAQFGVFVNMFLEGVCFPLQANCLHLFKQMPCFVVTLTSKGDK
jgi:hypothetical protein